MHAERQLTDDPDNDALPTPKLITAKRLAPRLGLSVSSVYELARRGELPCVRLGTSVRFDPAQIAERLRR